MTAGNPYLQILRQDSEGAMRQALLTAVDRQPDAEARLQGLARQYGLPVEAVRLDAGTVEWRARLDALPYDEIIRSMPATAQLLSDPRQAAIAHDDVENLGGLETLLNSFRRGVPALRSVPPALQGFNQASGLHQLDAIDSALAAGESLDGRRLGVLGEAYAGLGSAEERARFRDFYQPKAEHALGEAVANLAGLQAERQAIAQPGVVYEVLNAGDFGGAFRAFRHDPLRFLAAVGPESFVQSAPGLLAAIPAAVYGGPLGVAGAVGANSALVDYAGELVGNLQNAGVDVRDPAAVRAALADPETLAKMSEQAGKHAGMVGLFDAVSGGLAGKMLLPQAVGAKLVGRPLAREMAKIAAQLPVQAGLGAAGEAAGELAAGQAIQPGQILAEGVGELFGAPVEVAAASARRFTNKLDHAEPADSAKPAAKLDTQPDPQGKQGADLGGEKMKADAERESYNPSGYAPNDFVSRQKAGAAFAGNIAPELQNINRFLPEQENFQSGVQARSPSIPGVVSAAERHGAAEEHPSEAIGSEPSADNLTHSTDEINLAVGELGQSAGGRPDSFDAGQGLEQAFGELFGAPAAAISTAARRMDEQSRQAESAEQAAGWIERLNGLAAASKVLRRSPELVRGFVSSVLHRGGGPDAGVKSGAGLGDGNQVSGGHVYIGAKALLQSGVAEPVLAALPEVAEQMPAALAGGGEIGISLADYVTKIAPTAFAPALLEHSRLEGQRFNRAQAREHLAGREAALRAEVERVLKLSAADEALHRETLEIKQAMQDQLDRAGRFGAKVNERYAELTAHFYATQAERFGVSPAELWRRYPLRVVAGAGEGRAFGQILPEALPDGMALGDGAKAAAMYRGEDKTKAVLLNGLGGDLVKDALVAGVKLGAFSHSIDQSALNHIRNEHGNDTVASELERGQLPILDSDIEAIPDIVEHYDAVRFDLVNKLGRPMVAYAKNKPTGAFLYFEEVRNKRRDLAAHSMRKYPATSDAADILRNVPLYVRNDDGHGQSISDGENEGKILNQSNRLDEDAIGDSGSPDRLERHPSTTNARQVLKSAADGLNVRNDGGHDNIIEGSPAVDNRQNFRLREAATFEEARLAAKAFQSRPLTNAETGMVATVSRNTLDKMLNGKAVGKSETPALHALAVANLDYLFESAIDGWSKPDRDGNENLSAIHRFFSVLPAKPGAKFVKITVKEFVDPEKGNRIYSVEAVELGDKTPAAQWVDASVEADGLDLTSIRSAGVLLRLAQRVEDVNRPYRQGGITPDGMAQYHEIESKYFHPDGSPKPGAMFAPNGQPSILNKFQWIMVRTDNFKRFYGDWERAGFRLGSVGQDVLRGGVGDRGFSGADSGDAGFSQAGRHGADRDRTPRLDRGAEFRLGGLGREVAQGENPAGVSRGNYDAAGLSETGEPAVFYHGTRDDIEAGFDLEHPRRKDFGWLGRGVYVTNDPRLAKAYANAKQGLAHPNILPLFVAVKNPYIATEADKGRFKSASKAEIDRITVDMLADGYDGALLKYPDGTIEMVAFDPRLVKSAVANNGAFSLDDADILHQTEQAGSAVQTIMRRHADTFSQAREAAKAFLGKSLINYETGLAASVSRNNLDKMLSGKAVGKSVSSKIHALAVANVDALFEQARVGEIHADRGKDSNISTVQRFYAPLINESEVYKVKLTVKEFVNEQNRIYSVEALEVENAIASVDPSLDPVGVGGQVDLTRPPGDGVRDSIDQWLARVKRDVAGRYPQSYRGEYDPFSRTISLNANADLSTFLHESAHFFLDLQFELAAQLQQGESEAAGTGLAFYQKAGKQAGPVKTPEDFSEADLAALTNNDLPPGEYATKTKFIVENVRHLGTDRIRSAADAAQAMAFMSRYAAERFEGLVTDSYGKPLAIVGNLKGHRGASPFFPETIAAEAFRVQGAANIWFVHNHPGGYHGLSFPDRTANGRLSDVFYGSKIRMRGLLAIAGEKNGGRFWAYAPGHEELYREARGHNPQSGDLVGYTRPPVKTLSVPILDLAYADESGLGWAVFDEPLTNEDRVRLARGQSGVLLLDHGSHYNAYVPILEKTARNLRRPGRLDEWHRAVSYSNSHYAYIVNFGDLTLIAMENLMAFFNSLNIRVLDGILVGESGIGSFRESEQLGPLFHAAEKIKTFKQSWPKAEEDGPRTASRPIPHGGLAEFAADGRRQLLTDSRILLDWFGVASLAEWRRLDFEEKRRHHERFAEAFEVYLLEGKAPSAALRGLFARFKAWLLQVYRTLRAQAADLHQEVRGVFDRMLAGADEIRAQERAVQYQPLFSSAAQARMSAAEFAAYRSVLQAARMAAANEVGSKALADMQWLQPGRNRMLRAAQLKHRVLRRGARRQARSEVSAQPLYRAWDFLSRRHGGGKLDAGLAARIRPEAVGRLQALGMTATAGGLHPDAVAEMFGLSSGDEMLRGLAAAEPPYDLIRRLTNEKLLREHGELSSAEGARAAAERALHDDLRIEAVRMEADALAQAGGEMRLLEGAAQRQAAAMLRQVKLADLRPGLYVRAEARAAQAAAEALAAGDLQKAAVAKREQLIHLCAAREAFSRADEIAAGVGYLRGFAGGNASLNQADMGQITALLERFGLLRAAYQAAIPDRSLPEWLQAARARGLEPDIAPELLRSDYRLPYRDLRIGEFRGLLAAVRQIEHLGRNRGRVLGVWPQRRMREVRGAVLADLRKGGVLV